VTAVDEAVRAIREFLPNANRADAAHVLPVWMVYNGWRFDDLDCKLVLDEFDTTGWPATLHTGRASAGVRS
jgi:hypothetical protein